MLYLMWGSLNIGFLFLSIIICIQATKVIRKKTGLLESIFSILEVSRCLSTYKLAKTTSLLIVLFFSLDSLSHAQDSTYYDAKWEKTSKENAKYYRVAKRVGDKWKVMDYYISGQLQMEGYAVSIDPDTLSGIVSFYFEDGRIKHRENYVYEKVNFYDLPTYKQLKMLPHHTGIVSYWQDAKRVYQYFKDSTFKYSYYIAESKDTIYIKPEKEASPKKEIHKFIKKTYKNLKYPREARRLRIEGIVLVQFIIDENGDLKDFKVIKS